METNGDYAILTINDPLNYGNRLQNYALSNILSAYGDVTTIDFALCVRSPLFALRQAYRRFNTSIIKPFIYPILGGDARLKGIRQLKTNAFTQSYTPANLLSLTKMSGLKNREAIEIKQVVIGSDQVWNYTCLRKDDLALRLGSFCPEGTAVSYAASMGIADLSSEIVPIYHKFLSRLKAISVREERAKELIEERMGLSATVVLDPTLMLERSVWESIFEGFVPENDRYVLTYFLGEPNDDQRALIAQVARERGARIRKINDLIDAETYVAAPQDFVELIAKSEYVFTDSYHACCFSILFEKQFKVFNRKGYSGTSRTMNSRMETLFNHFGLKDFMFSDTQVEQVDYAQVNARLNELRLKSYRWLEDNIRQ